MTIVYPPKLKLMVRRAAKRLRPSDRISNPPSVMQSQLIVRVNETRPSCHYSLPAEVKNDGVESCKVPEAL